MSDVTREEFDALARRVGSLERSLAAIAELLAERIIPHLEGIETKLDTYTAQVNVAIGAATATAGRHERFMNAIAAHFGIDLGEP
ncbi:MAG TPA: hypothetical protein VLL25_16800 [Acidimicrobiales bacterium]|nr:hypothetical protein [Acidimicrobiales bacterium]